MLCKTDPEGLQASASYWWPRVRASFGASASPRFDALQSLGLRHEPNARMIAAWETRASDALSALNLSVPA